MRPLVLGLSLLAMPVSADSLQIHLQSDHASGCKTCNERNLGIGWRGDGRFAPTVGYYKNSWDKDSFYGGMNYRFVGGLSGGLGIVTGYRDITSNGVFLMPIVHWDVMPNSQISPMLSWIPTLDGGVGLLSINIKMD